MRTIVILWAALISLASTRSARADAIDDPCQVKELGAPCTNLDGEPGTCVEGELDDFVCSDYDPCDGRQATAPCTKPGTNEEGTCQDDGDGGLACVAGEPSGSTTTSSGTSSTTTGAAGGSGGDGGDDGGAGGGASGSSTEDEGCSVKAPGKKGATRAGAAGIFLAAAALTVARAVRRRRATDGR